MAITGRKLDVKSLESILNAHNPTLDVTHTRRILKQALQCCTQKKISETELLLPGVTKYLSSLDILSKKLAIWFVTVHKGKSDLLLAVNSLMKDCSSPNPQIRCLALKTLSNFPQADFVDYSLQVAVKGLGDSSGYVRRAAVIACSKLNQTNPQFVEESEVVDILYGMIRDKDSIVVLNTLQVLDEILAKEGGIVINKNIAHYLLNHIGIFPEWGNSIIIGYLRKYQPKSEDDIYDIMNVLDDHLLKGNAATVVEIVDYFLQLSKEIPALQSDILGRARDPLLHFLGVGNPELTTVVIEYLQKIYLPDHVSELEHVYASFLCKQKEPLFVKCKRIDILCHVVNSNNVQDIVDELILYSTTPTLCRPAIKAVGTIAMKSKSFQDLCIKKLVQMLDMGTSQVKVEVFSILSTLNTSSLDANILKQLMGHIGNALETEKDPRAVSSLLWSVGDHGDELEDMVYILENFLQDFTSWDDSALCNSLLIASVKLLVKKPAEYQHIVGQLMENCHNFCERSVKETVVYYYNLLKQNPEVIKSVVL